MIATRKLQVETKGSGDILDITQPVARQVAGSGIKSGTVTLFVTGSTAGITTMEFESGLVSDFQALWRRFIPEEGHYHHDLRWGDKNGYSHLRASVLKPCLVVPFVAGQMTLGTWQQVVLLDFDNKPRSREVVLQIMGE